MTRGQNRRVLIEDSDGATAWASRRVLEREGYEVDVCGGPAELERGRCPLAHEGRCDLAERAEVILYALGPEHRDVFEAERRLLPRVPMVIKGEPDDIAALGPAADTCATIPMTVNRAALARAIGGASTG